MFKFIDNYLAKKKAKAKYEESLSRCLETGILDESIKKDLDEIKKNDNLTEYDIKPIHIRLINLYFQRINVDERINDHEKKSLEELMNYFSIHIDDFNFDQKLFNKNYALEQLEKGILPKSDISGLNVALGKDEFSHWGCPAQLRKYRHITNRINYKGLTSSIKIMKGLRYRMGSLGYQTQTQENLITEDVGFLWITNKRIGFKGQRKIFAVPLSKILNIELTLAGIEVAKEGKEVPYIFALDDYQIPAAILTMYLNKK